MVFLLSRAILLAAVVLWIWCIFDVIRAPAGTTRYLPKMVWLAVVVLVEPIGALAWLLFGRPENVGSRLVGSERARAAAPDDSPEFLRQVDEEIRRRRRADKLRKPPDAASDEDVDEEIKRLEREFRRRSDEDPKA